MSPTAKTNTDVEDLISFSQFLWHDLEKKVQFLMHDKKREAKIRETELILVGPYHVGA